MTTESQHEDLTREHIAEGGSDRSFGVVFAVIFSVIGLWGLWGLWPVFFRGAQASAVSSLGLYWCLLLAAIALLGIAWIRPTILAPANRLWTRFGIVLGKIISPIMLGIVFFLVVTPTALVMRLIGRDLLSRTFDDSIESYWVKRDPSTPESMKNQF